MTQRSPFKYFKNSPEVIRLAVMLYVRFPLSFRNVEDLLPLRLSLTRMEREARGLGRCDLYEEYVGGPEYG